MTLKKYISAGLISIGIASGGFFIIWNTSPKALYCEKSETIEIYSNQKDCVSVKSRDEVIDSLTEEGIPLIDNFCSKTPDLEIEEVDPKWILIYRIAVANEISVSSGDHDLSKVVSDGRDFVYCDTNDYLTDRNKLFNDILNDQLFIGDMFLADSFANYESQLQYGVTIENLDTEDSEKTFMKKVVNKLNE